MVKELLYKWFGLEPLPCPTCEVLRSQLDYANRERERLLGLIVNKDKPEPVTDEVKELKPIRTNSFVPWKVRQAALEAEDREKARLLELHKREVEMSKKSTEELEKELGIDEKEGA